MKTCDKCGKKISSLEAYNENGKTLCMNCAVGTTYKKEKLEREYLKKEPSNVEKVNNYVNKIKLKSTNGWAFGMKILTLILLVVLVFSSLALAIYASVEEDNIILGFGIFVGLFVLSFSIVGFAMTFLQLAEDVSCIKNFIKSENKNDNNM